MEKATNKARKAGYNRFDKKEVILAKWENDKEECEVNGHFLLDPLFWQALGKAEGWINTPCNTAFLEGMSHRPKICKDCNRTAAMSHWHRFIDHLAEGKDADSFFNELFKSYEKDIQSKNKS
jgi:hypothetical protein